MPTRGLPRHRGEHARHDLGPRPRPPAPHPPLQTNVWTWGRTWWRSTTPLVLAILAEGETRHAIIKRVAELSGGASWPMACYPVLHRLEPKAKSPRSGPHPRTAASGSTTESREKAGRSAAQRQQWQVVADPAEYLDEGMHV